MSPLDISSSPNQRWLAKEFASSLEQSHRSTRHDVHGYVEFANHLAETDGPEPDPDFRAALRHRLLHELIEDELVPRPDELAIRRDERSRRKGGSHCFERAPREPWIAAASTVLVVCGGAIGLGQESSQALPGDSLYPVKRFFENGEMTIASSPSDQAHELMEQASERLDEARQLVKVDEVHAQQAVPATIVDFNEATADAGELVIEEGQSGSAAGPTLVSEFRAFSSQAQVALEEIAGSVDGETSELIAVAQSTLDGIEQQLPALDSILDAVGDVPLASDGLDVLDLNGQNNGHGSVLPDLDSSSAATVPMGANKQADSTPVEDVSEAIEPVTEPLDRSVAVVEMAAKDGVSMAVATVNSTVNTVDRTVRRTLDATTQAVDRTVRVVDQTVKQATEAVDQTVKQTTEAVNQTVKQTTEAVDQTLEQATEAVDQTVNQTTEVLQQATSALQQPTSNDQAEPDNAEPDNAEPDNAEPDNAASDNAPDKVEDTVQGLQSATDNLLTSTR